VTVGELVTLVPVVLVLVAVGEPVTVVVLVPVAVGEPVVVVVVTMGATVPVAGVWANAGAEKAYAPMIAADATASERAFRLRCIGSLSFV
jgi:hypothetical protein